MAFGTGAVTAAVVGGLASGAVGAGAGMLSGALGGSGSSAAPAYPSGKIDRIMDTYVGDVAGDIFGPAGAEAIAAQAAMDNWKTRNKKGSKGSEKEYYDPVAKTWISESEFSARRSALNQRSLTEDVAKLGDELSSDVSKIIADGDKTFAEKQAELQKAVDAENATFEQTQTSLADRFLQAIGTAKGEFDQDWATSLDLSPERLSLFTQAADFLSQAAVDTRAKMLASADPRALELSAIADENAAAMMSGRISADMQANLARTSAYQALQGGYGASSAMGRGLTARDLGLTSLDLMTQGSALYDSQRRLNYDTRVAGLQTDASALLTNDQRARQQQALTNYEVGISSAESDRNQRGTTANAIYGTNLATAGNLFGTSLDRLNQNTTLLANTATNIYGSNVNALGQGFDALTQARAAAAGTQVTGLQNAWAAQNNWAASQASSQAALTGSYINSTASLLGNAAGTLSSLGSFKNPYGGTQQNLNYGNYNNDFWLAG